MGRLIDADALMNQIQSFHCNNCDRRKGTKNGEKVFCYQIGDAPCRACGTGDAIEYLEDAPTVDAVPVEWLHKLMTAENDDVDKVEYMSPIEIIAGQIQTEMDNCIVRAIQKQGIAVDKGELIRALRYDREQYRIGYTNGYNAALRDQGWISVEDRLPEHDGTAF